MEIVITKSLSNKKFISKKHKDYHNLSRFTERLWLSEEISVISDGSVIYSLNFSKGSSVEGMILGTGHDEIGFYIVFNMSYFNLNNDSDCLFIKRIPCGRAELREVFNPHEDKAFRALKHERYMCQYPFQRSTMRSNPTHNGMILEFELGTLGDKGFRIELSQITKEHCACENDGGLASFEDGKIREVYFRKYKDEEYTIKIDNSYKEPIFSKGTDCLSEMGKLEFIEHKNKYTISCKHIIVERFNYFINSLISLGIRCIELHNTVKENYAQVLRERWKKVFLSGVNTDDIYIDQYLWHVFSYGRLEAVTGAKAKECLDKACSDTLYIFLNDSNGYEKDICYKLEKASAFNPEILNCYSDVYVTDEDFTWTYVKTHEDEYCGPYFYNRVTK